MNLHTTEPPPPFDDSDKIRYMLVQLYYHCFLLPILFLMLDSIRRCAYTSILFFLLLAALGSFSLLVFALVARELIEGYAHAHLAAHLLAWYGSFFLFASALLMYRQKKSNGKPRRKTPTTLVILGCIYLGIAIDALLIEPEWLIIREITIATPKITKPMTIVFCADMQTDHVGSYERRTLQKIKEQNADVILFGGDYIQGDSDEANQQLLSDWNQLFREIDLQAPLGVYAIQGNKELKYQWREMFKDTAVIPQSQTLSMSVGEVRISFLSVRGSWIQRTVADMSQNSKFRIMLGHMPVYATADQEADLLLAGHTHGGQIQLPFWGPLLTNSRNLPRRWTSGVTSLPSGGTLIVTNGSGLARGTAPRIRFYCRPDFWVIRLVPSKAG